jgi:hypothetical protein
VARVMEVQSGPAQKGEAIENATESFHRIGVPPRVSIVREERRGRPGQRRASHPRPATRMKLRSPLRMVVAPGPVTALIFSA